MRPEETPPRPRRVEARRFGPGRRFVAAALRAGRHRAPMHGLLQLDVTEATRLLEAPDPSLSFTAFVIAAVARAAAAHPEVHAYRDWRGRLVTQRHVDVSTIVEIPTPDGPFPLVHTVRDADVREVRDLSDELRAVKALPIPHRRPVAARVVRLATRIPSVVRITYLLLSRSVRLRQRSGTVSVTAVGMFAQGGGFAIAPLTLMSLQVVVGGVSEQPRVLEHRVEVRTVVDLTVSLDHHIVDGGPATRFGAELRHLIETAGPLR